MVASGWLWIRITLINADPDPAFHFNADADPAFHFNAGPDPDPAHHQTDANLKLLF